MEPHIHHHVVSAAHPRSAHPRQAQRLRGARRAAAAAAAGLLVVAAALAMGSSATAAATGAVIRVPADQPTLQAAVQAAASGDTILLAPGTYTGGVLVQDKALRFASWYETTGDTAYIAQTVLNGYAPGYCGAASGCAGNAVLEFASRAGGSVVNGLTVQNGVDGVRASSRVDVFHSRMVANGDGIDYGNGSSGSLGDDVFANNTDDGLDLNGQVSISLYRSTIQANEGDGIEFRMYPYVGTNLPIDIHDNRFVANDSDGIQLIDSDGASSRTVSIQRNVFDHNGAAAVGVLPNQQTNEDFSGAQAEERISILDNTFSGGRYGVVGGGNSVVLNNVFTGLTASALRRVGTSSMSAYNLFWANGTDAEESVVDGQTTVHADPLLGPDLTLQSGSPAIDAGTASYQWRSETVLSIPQGAYSGTAPDLGAFEFTTGGPPVNRAPAVDAGTDQGVTLPAGATLDGTVTDDGLPSGTLTTTWTQANGPGTTSFAKPAAIDTTATFSTAGTYLLQLAATDGALTTTDTLQVTVQATPPPPPPGSGSIERRIATNTDDVEESATGSYGATSTDLELVFDHDNQKVGLRFPNLTIPAGATITNAWIQFTTDEKQSEATTLTITGQASDNAAAFTSATKPSTRPRTTAATTWTPPAWNLVGEAGTAQRTPDLSTTLQEVINRPGWASGNALALIITGTGHRTATAYDGTPAKAPLLHIDYTTGG